ncbi:MAG: hypothetical protein ACPG8W_10660, partial [Candidatus Promineifilaceae bacterium]
LNVLLQYFILPTDASVRLIPTLFGLATLLLPWTIRDRLGNVGALVTTLLLAASPIHQAISRLAGGDAIAVFAGLLLFISWVKWSETAEHKQLLIIALAGALGLSSSPLFYSFLDNFIVIWFLQRVLGPRLAWPQPTRDQWQQAGIVAALTFSAASTLLFWNPAGFGGAANLFAAWLQQFSLGKGFLTPWLALLRYELIPVLLGVLFTLWLLSSANPLARWLTYWLIGSMLLILVQAGEMSNLALLTLPLFMLIGLGANRILTNLLVPKVWLITLLIISWGFIFLVGIGRYAKLPPENVAPVLIAFILLLAVGLFIIVLNPNTHEFMHGLLLGVLCIGVYLGWGTGWALTHHTGNDPRELWVTDGTDADLRLMRETLQEGSYQVSRSQRALSLISTVDTPAMRWYLRDFEDVDYAEAVPRDTASDGIITNASAAPALSGSYARTDFDAEVMGLTEQALSFNQTFRWWFFRQGSTELEIDRISLWLYVKNE